MIIALLTLSILTRCNGFLLSQTHSILSYRPFRHSMIPPLTSKSYLPRSQIVSKRLYCTQSNSTFQAIPTNISSKSIDDFKRQIFCNIELPGHTVEAVGFDMDFTLAQYKESFDLLAFEGAKRKLVYNLGYPDEVLNFKYDRKAFRRGLIVDKKRGNILKVDRHKYVIKAYHGLSKELTACERKKLYSKEVETFTERNYVNIDTLFHPIDAIIFTNMVELKDSTNLICKSYDDVYKDIRACVDICHRDGAIKDVVMEDPASYIIYDENTVPLLQRLKKAGKKVFLLTNSMWEYTNKVMDFLVHGGGMYKDLDWKSLFDCITVGACKPAFMAENYLSMFLVQESGLLKNIDDNEIVTPRYLETTAKVFQGGCWNDLHRMLGVSTGDKILYVGDHMFADILRSKRSLGWRTCLIIPELESEIEIANNEKVLYGLIQSFRWEQCSLEDQIDRLRMQRDSGVDNKELEAMELLAVKLKERVRSLSDEYNSKFNPYWGQLFKSGHQDSRFAKQVMDYACLYTSRATNLALVYPNRIFRPVKDYMPHEALFSTETYTAHEEFKYA